MPQLRLQRQRTGGCLRQRLVQGCLFGHRPDDGERVPGEVHDVTTARRDDVDHAPEVIVEVSHQPFDTN